MPCRPCKDDKTILREWALVPSRQEWASIFMNGWAHLCAAADSPYVFLVSDRVLSAPLSAFGHFPRRGKQGPPGASAPTAGTSSGASRHLPRARGRLCAAAVGILRRLSKAWSFARFPRVGMLLRMTARGTHAIPNELRTPQFRMHPLAPEPGKDLHGEGESAIIQAAH